MTNIFSSMPKRCRRRLAGAAPATAALALMAGAFLAAGPAVPAGAATNVWHVSHSPKIRVSVARVCPTTVKGYQDVVNTFAGPPLVPAAPRAGLVCWYPRAGAKLAKTTHLTKAEAVKLATAVRKLSLKPPTAVFHCPADFGSVGLIALSYNGRGPVGLWYSDSGCQTLDNGRLGSFQGANPSFYNGFEKVIDKLSPPPTS
jgi:hypothetical protein